MKYFILSLMMGLMLFMGCDTGTGNVVEDDPIVDPVEEVLTWLETVPGGFFELIKVSDEGTFNRSVGDVTTINGVYIVFEEDGDISLWSDFNDNGILEPEDYVGSAGNWELIGDALYINEEPFTVGDVEINTWNMTLDISEEFENCLGEAGYEVEGTRTFFYERANPVYMTNDMLITTDFNIVYDDMGDALYNPGYWWGYASIDCIDMIGFTFGDAQFLIYNQEFGFSYVNVNGNNYAFEGFFEANEVYDVDIYVQPNDIGRVTAVSRVDGDVITADILVDYASLGDVELKQVNDCDSNLL